MTKKEELLILRHEGTYKGWICTFTGCGHVHMRKGGVTLYAYRDEHTLNWLEKCWAELKSRIDRIEAAAATREAKG